MKLTMIAALLISAAFPSFAQSGWSRLGEALGSTQQSRQDAYNRGAMQGLEQAYLIESVRAARRENDHIEAEAALQDALVSDWQKAGLSEQEAIAVAKVYRLTNEQDAIIIRARKEGAKATFEQAAAAYRAFNYQLANELVIAGKIVASSQGEAKQPAG